MYAEHDGFTSLHPLDDGVVAGGAPEGDGQGEGRGRGAQNTAAVAFWRGIGLVREGGYAESIAKFSEAVEEAAAAGGDADARIHSLALEYYGSFLYLMGDMAGSLEHLRCVAVAWVRVVAFRSRGRRAAYGVLAYILASAQTPACKQARGLTLTLLS